MRLPKRPCDPAQLALARGHMAKAEKPKPKPKPTKRAQYERFKETARELGVDESMEDFEAKFRKIVPPKRPSPSRAGGRRRDGE